MKAVEANFLKFLKKSDQLEVPIYQRTYSWTRPECLQLWSDIVRASDKKVAGHFIGSIVYIDTGIYQVSGANAIEIIDGHQRLTTLSLLLLALTRALDSDGDSSAATPRKLIKDYLLQEDDEDPGVEARYKLLLTKSDRDTFMRLIDGREIDASQAPRLVDSYNLFVDQLKRRRCPRIRHLQLRPPRRRRRRAHRAADRRRARGRLRRPRRPPHRARLRPQRLDIHLLSPSTAPRP
jgi:Protein of unknown function DUF262